MRIGALITHIIFRKLSMWDEGVPSTSLNCWSSLPARQFGVGHSKAARDVKVAVSRSNARRLAASSEAQSLPAGHIPVLGSVLLLGVSSFRANHARYIFAKEKLKCNRRKATGLLSCKIPRLFVLNSGPVADSYHLKIAWK